MSTNDLGVMAQIAYNAGIKPLDWAEEQVAIQLGVYGACLVGRDELEPLLGTLDLSPAAMARRILGGLLDAGWKLPEVPGAETLEVS